MSDLIGLIKELKSEFCERKGLLGKKIDVARCYEITSELSEALPPILAQAEEIIASREKILSNADVVAKNIIKEAEARAEQLASNTEITKAAERQGCIFLEKTYRECDLLVQKTKEHLDSMFKDAEAFFGKTLELIKTNRNELRSAFAIKKK